MGKKIENSKSIERFRAYFHDTVILAYDFYIKQRKNGLAGRNADLRAFTNAAEHLYHVREHLPEEFSMTKKEMCSRTSDYDLLGDIANALKHKTLTRGNPRLTDSENISEETIITTFKDKQGKYFHAETVVTAKLDDGTCRDGLDILTNVVNAWLAYFNEVGISSKKPKLFPVRNPHKIVKRNDARNPNFSLTKGVELKLRYIFQEFNYVSGKVEIVDLTEFSNIEFRLYRKPLSVVDLQAIHHDASKSLNFRVIFSDEDEKKLDKLKTKKSKVEFVKNLIQERKRRNYNIIYNDGSTEYEILFPDDDFKKIMRFRKDETRQNFLTDILKDLEMFSVKKGKVKRTL